MQSTTASPSPGGDPQGRFRAARESAGASVRPMLDLVLAALENGQADQVVTIDLIGKSAIADALVIASGRSQRQVAALAERVIADLKANTDILPKVEGAGSADWVLIDAGDIVIHVFRPEVRAFYNLEKLWSADVAEQPAKA